MTQSLIKQKNDPNELKKGDKACPYSTLYNPFSRTDFSTNKINLKPDSGLFNDHKESVYKHDYNKKGGLDDLPIVKNNFWDDFHGPMDYSTISTY